VEEVRVDTLNEELESALGIGEYAQWYPKRGKLEMAGY